MDFRTEERRMVDDAKDVNSVHSDLTAARAENARLTAELALRNDCADQVRAASATITLLADAELIMDKMERDGWRLTPFRALAAEVRALRELLAIAESGRKAERNLRLNSEEECGALRKDRERIKSDLEAPVELIQRWGCECEPQIGFTCGPCRVVELIDAALAAAKGE